MRHISLKLISLIIICIVTIFMILLFFNIIKESNIALILSVLSIFISLYTIYKTDEQVNRQIKKSEELTSKELLFGQKQEAFLILMNELNEYKIILDTEYINSHDKKIYYENLEDIENYIANIVNFIHDIRFSLYFNYYPQDVQELIDEFLNYSNQHFDAEYFDIQGIPFKDNEEYMKLLNLLKEIYDNLKKEIGKNV